MKKTFRFFKWTGKKAVFLFVLSVALVVTSVNVTVAVLLTRTETIENTFSPPVLHISLEGIDDIKNTGDLPVYVRAYSIVNWYSLDDEHTILADAPQVNVDFQVTFHTGGWFLASDGFYYYEKVLNPGEQIQLMTHAYQLTEKDGYRVEFSSDTSVEIRADRTMLLQVIYNLINNAINYTGEDRLVRVTQSLSEDGTRVRVSVSDHGVGIAPDQIPLIWDRYYKIDKVHRRAMIGTGLGLSIVKQILEAHRATYGVDSKLGEGSTFWFEMRVEAVIAEEAEDLGGGAEDTPCLSAQDTQA